VLANQMKTTGLEKAVFLDVMVHSALIFLNARVLMPKGPIMQLRARHLIHPEKEKFDKAYKDAYGIGPGETFSILMEQL